MTDTVSQGFITPSFNSFERTGRAEQPQKPIARLAPARLPPGSRLLGPAAVLLIWEASSQLGLLSPNTLAAPSTAIVTGLHMLADGSLLPHLLASAGRAYSGLFLGVVVGVILALLSGLTRSGEVLIDGLVQIKRAVPTLALIPLVIIWLGIGEAMKIFLIFTAVMVPIYINAHAALRGIDIGYVELARTLGLTRGEFVRQIVLPGALPGFFVALRLAVALCWTALVVLELINTQAGIGYLMNRARDWGQTDIIVVGIIIYAVLGLASDAVVRMIEARALSYRRSLGVVIVAPSPAPPVALRDLSRSFKGRTVLDRISLEIPHGQFVALLGESGSGKTTLLRALAGLDDDAETHGHFTVPAHTSVLFQDSRLLPWLTVIDNVRLGLRRPDATPAAVDMLAAVGLGDKADVWPATLSGGQKQRASLARSLLREPELLLADEPFGALDALTRIRMHRLLIRLVERERPTVILVTHDVDEALLLSDRVLVLKGGQIAEDHAVDLPQPRHTHLPSFAALRQRLLRSLGVEADAA